MKKLKLPICWRKDKKLTEELFNSVRNELILQKSINDELKNKLYIYQKFQNGYGEEDIVLEQYFKENYLFVSWITTNISIDNDFSIRGRKYYVMQMQEIYNMDVRIDRSSQSCEIIDWSVGEFNKGYGKEAIAVLKRICRFLEVKRIWGWLSPVDLEDASEKEHGDRLIHFYEKQGFVIRDRLGGCGKVAEIKL